MKILALSLLVFACNLSSQSTFAGEGTSSSSESARILKTRAGMEKACASKKRNQGCAFMYYGKLSSNMVTGQCRELTDEKLGCFVNGNDPRNAKILKDK